MNIKFVQAFEQQSIFELNMVIGNIIKRKITCFFRLGKSTSIKLTIANLALCNNIFLYILVCVCSNLTA